LYIDQTTGHQQHHTTIGQPFCPLEIIKQSILATNIHLYRGYAEADTETIERWEAEYEQIDQAQTETRQREASEISEDNTIRTEQREIQEQEANIIDREGEHIEREREQTSRENIARWKIEKEKT
jgi:hypothetical protein